MQEFNCLKSSIGLVDSSFSWFKGKLVQGFNWFKCLIDISVRIRNGSIKLGHRVKSSIGSSVQLVQVFN